MTELGGEHEAGTRGVLWEMLGYVGGALVLGGASLLLNMSWEDLSRFTKIVLLAVAVIVLTGSGVLIGGGLRLRTLASATTPRGRVVTVLFVLCSGTTAMAVGTGVEAYEGVTATLVGVLVAVAGCCALPSTPGLLTSGGLA